MEGYYNELIMGHDYCDEFIMVDDDGIRLW